MRIRKSVQDLALVAAVSLALAAHAVAPCLGRAAAETTAALRSALEDNPPPAERVEACVRLLQEEMAHPSKPAFGIGGGPMDSGYLQGVIMRSVCTFGQKGSQRESIRSIIAVRLAATPESDQPMRDRLAIMLGCTGDLAVIPQLVSILEKHPEGFMRFNAALALREMPDCAAAIPALRHAVESDTYARIRFGGSLQRYDAVTMAYSPLREAAAKVLRKAGIAIPRGVEVLAAKHAVDRLAPLLYDSTNPECGSTAIEILGMIGGIEAKGALEAFVAKETGTSGMESLVEQARAVLTKIGAAN